jgi:hypothetical protein
MALSTWPKGEWMVAIDEQEAGRKIASTTKYMRMMFAGRAAEEPPRGTDWMPSSPPVNGPAGRRSRSSAPGERDHREVDALPRMASAPIHPERRRPRSPGRMASSGGQPHTFAAWAGM